MSVELETPSLPMPLPMVRLEVRQAGRSVPYVFDQVDFLIGAVAGCDLRVPGADLPAVLCLLARHPDGVRLRRLAATQILLLNGQPVSRSELKHGDRITIGAMDIVVAIEAAPAASAEEYDEAEDETSSDLAEREAALRDVQKKLDEATAKFRRERDAWEIEKAKTPARPPLPAREEIGADLLQRELAVAQREEEATRKHQLLDTRSAEIEKQKQEIAGVRQELSDIRQQLYDRYQERRDRLSGLKESVDRAAQKVQDAKRSLEADQRAFAQQRADVERRAAEFDKSFAAFDAERTSWQKYQNDVETDFERKLADLSAREEKVAAQRATLEAREAQYRDDVVRLDRRQGELETREKEVAEGLARCRMIQEQLRLDSEELERQAREFDEQRAEAQAELARFEEQTKAFDARQKQLDERAAVLEGQQTALTTLRGKLERMRDEFRQHDQMLETERLALAETARKTALHQDDVARRENELKAQIAAMVADKQQIAERQTALAAAMAKLEDAQDRIAADEDALRTRSHKLDERMAANAEQEAILRGRLEQFADAQSRLDQERQTLRERTVVLAETEKAREALQEQLRKRSEVLAQKQKELHEQSLSIAEREAKLDKRDDEILAKVAGERAAVEAARLAVDNDRHEVDTRRAALVELQAMQTRQIEELNAKSRAVADEQRALAEQQTKSQELLGQQHEQIKQKKDEIEALKREARELLLELPDVELRAGTAIDRLSHTREQLRDHLGEVQAFIRQAQEDLDAAQTRLRHEDAELAQKSTDFRRLHDEHRVALIAFRQQIIDWQAQVKDVERQLKKEDRGLENRQSKIEDRAEKVDAVAAVVAKENTLLAVQKEVVAEQRGELDRHVGDLRDWYRRKMRELAGGPDEAEIVDATAAQIEGESEAPQDAPLVPTERDILSITGPLDQADRTLAEALQAHQLLDASAVHALLVEARRQRRSLKQIVLASAAATPYQIALLETGQVDGLSVGPFRVIDRLRQTPHESIYRVYDARRGRESLLRHLSVDAAADAVLPDEYRQRFSQLVVPEAHLAGTLEVVDIDGRPAIVQEWLMGLPASDWPPLAAAPGVCYRLFTQAALGLAALHKHGLVHGRLHEQHLLLTPQGLLKLCGANEPSWLHAGESGTAADDIRRLGEIVSGWCSPGAVRKGPKAKPLPNAMIAILLRLRNNDYASVRALLDDLDGASNDVPANPEAWDRLLRYVRDHAQPEAMLRQSA